MGKRWRLILPTCGLLLFLFQTYGSIDLYRHFQHNRRYFWWSSIRLDTTPLAPRTPQSSPCTDKTENCVGWDPDTMWVEPSVVAKVLMLSAFPAFLAGALLVGGLSRLGVSELTSFMTAMPPLIGGWFYSLGWVLDRRRLRRALLKKQP